MSAERTDMHRLQGLVRLHRMGKGARTVARLLCISPNTERQYCEILQRADLLSGEPDKLRELWLLKEAVRSCARKSLEKEDGARELHPALAWVRGPAHSSLPTARCDPLQHGRAEHGRPCCRNAGHGHSRCTA